MTLVSASDSHRLQLPAHVSACQSSAVPCPSLGSLHRQKLWTVCLRDYLCKNSTTGDQPSKEQNRTHIDNSCKLLPKSACVVGEPTAFRGLPLVVNGEMGAQKVISPVCEGQNQEWRRQNQWEASELRTAHSNMEEVETKLAQRLRTLGVSRQSIWRVGSDGEVWWKALAESCMSKCPSRHMATQEPLMGGHLRRQQQQARAAHCCGQARRCAPWGSPHCPWKWTECPRNCPWSQQKDREMKNLMKECRRSSAGRVAFINIKPKVASISSANPSLEPNYCKGCILFSLTSQFKSYFIQRQSTEDFMQDYLSCKKNAWWYILMHKQESVNSQTRFAEAL